MKITLNAELQNLGRSKIRYVQPIKPGDSFPQVEYIHPSEVPAEYKVNELIGRLATKGANKFISASLNEEIETTSIGFVAVLAESYSNHLPIVVSPYDLWFIYQTQLAKMVGDDIEKYRPLFSMSDQKQKIMVPTNDITEIDPFAIIQSLKTYVPANISDFIPKFSYDNATAQVSLAAAFCDLVSPYYSYSTFMCGIPSIKLLGTVNDWEQLELNSAKIFQAFLKYNPSSIHREYLEQAQNIFRHIAISCREEVISEESISFWKNIFTQKNVGSGSQLKIGGWINTLHFDKTGASSARRLEEFAASYAKIEYTNMETKREFIAYYGPFTTRTVMGMLVSEFGAVVFEKG